MDEHTALSAEERFLLCAAKLGWSREDGARAEALSRDTAFSWDRMLSLATQHGVGALVAYNLDQARERFQVPEYVQKRIDLARFSARLRTALYAQAVGPVLGELASQSIRCALMKGIALTETLFPPGTRWLHDVDLLIVRRDYPRVAAVLESHGFHKALRGRQEGHWLRTYHQVTFVKRHAEALLGVDLHWLVYPENRPFFVDTPRLLGRARPHAYAGASILTFSPEDVLVHYATQLVNDRLRTSFSRAVDIHAVVQRGIDWKRFRAVAHQWRAKGAACVALGLAAMLGAHVPPCITRHMEYACPGCATATLLLADPRWILGRCFLTSPARQATASWLEMVPRRRLAHALRLPQRYWPRSSGWDGSLPRAAIRATAKSLQVLESWAALTSLRAADACGATSVRDAIRASFWHGRRDAQ